MKNTEAIGVEIQARLESENSHQMTSHSLKCWVKVVLARYITQSQYWYLLCYTSIDGVVVGSCHLCDLYLV